MISRSFESPLVTHEDALKRNLLDLSSGSTAFTSLLRQVAEQQQHAAEKLRYPISENARAESGALLHLLRAEVFQFPLHWVDRIVGVIGNAHPGHLSQRPRAGRHIRRTLCFGDIAQADEIDHVRDSHTRQGSLGRVVEIDTGQEELEDIANVQTAEAPDLTTGEWLGEGRDRVRDCWGTLCLQMSCDTTARRFYIPLPSPAERARRAP